MKTLNPIKLFLMAVMTFSGFYSQATESKIPQILPQATFYLFTNPDCGACVELKKKLEATGQYEQLNITYQGKVYQLPIKRIDPWVDNSDQFKEIGYLNMGIPQFSIVSNGEVKGASLFKDIYNIEFQNIQRDQLLPSKDEDLKKYIERLQSMMAANEESPSKSVTVDLSTDVLRSLGVNKAKLKPNPNFKPRTSEKNILIVGTADLPVSNPVFTGITIDKVTNSLANITNIDPIVLYGTGASDICDTCQVKSGDKIIESATAAQNQEEYEKSRELVKYQIDADESPTRDNIVSFFKSAKDSNSKKNLMVLVGHGIPTGFPTWLDLFNEFTPSDLERLHRHTGAENILVSGNCYGGIMANKVSCAFLAAHPDVTASGCWEDADTGKDLPDYVSVFFKSLKDPKSDYNSDGKVSFSEAHSYAIINGAKEDKPYTTEDALADEYFKSNPDALYENIQIAYLQKLLAKSYGTPEEKAALNELVKKHKPTDFIHLRKRSKEVNLGPVTATHTYDPNTSEHTFSNTKITDLALLKEKGLPGGVTDVKVEMWKTTDENGKEKDQISLTYLNPDPTWGEYLSELNSIEIIDSLKAKGFTSDTSSYSGQTVTIGPFEGELDYFSDTYVNLKNLKVSNQTGFDKIRGSYDLPDDIRIQEVTIWDFQESPYLSYKSEIRNKEWTSYSSLSDIDLNFVPEKSVNKSLLTLTRRLIFKSKISNNPSFSSRHNAIKACSQQGVSEFLNN